MTEAVKSIFQGVSFHSKSNNTEHHTSEISVDELIVRRGQSFLLTLTLAQPFNPDLHPLTVNALTGQSPSEDQGTYSCFGIPDIVGRSPSAKAVWKIELQNDSSTQLGILNFNITPPADAPIGEYVLTVKYKEEETLMALLTLLFNPWCLEDNVFMPDEEERQEYVMNEQGIIFRGAERYINSIPWDFGQFEEDMVRICMKILDISKNHLDDPANDVAARCDPIYVSRVVSAMINSEGDYGVLEGRWANSFRGGFSPGHWSGSHAILKPWYIRNCHPVKYGQCWVFAGVMCSVMRLLGIPCRTVTNYQSAHDTNKNLYIDVYHADYGVREKDSPDSVWNYHVWVEGWMRRPDLAEDGKYDGWQVLDPTPQEMSNGVYCCGPTSVKAIHNGDTDLKYDVPFVFAEVNADCIDWLVKADGSKINIFSETKRVGHNISTKSVGSNKRMNITDTYKHREGSESERNTFKYALTRDYTRDEEDMKKEEGNEVVTGTSGGTGGGAEDNGADTGTPGGTDGGAEEKEAATGTSRGPTEVTLPVIPPLPQVSIGFQEVSECINGKDLNLMLVLNSVSTVARPLSINISIQAMTYNGKPAVNIQTEVKEEILQPGKDLLIPIQVLFSAYHKPMVQCDSMKVSAVVTDKERPDNMYLAEDDIVLLLPPISVTVSGRVTLFKEAKGKVIFKNPLNEVLTDCTLTLSGSGLMRDEAQCQLPDLKPKQQFRISFTFFPYKAGLKTIMADLDCSSFRDIKDSCTVNVLQ